MRRILVPTDGSDSAKAAFAKALELAKKYRGNVTVANVIEPVSWTMATPDALMLEKKAEEWQAAVLADAAKEARKAGLKVKAVALRGDIAEEIVKYARKERCDLIVMGSRGLSPTERFLLGSVSEKVLRHAPCSVLVVRK
jgi:nucleotide-binding universal stress UspA family protein